MSHPKLRVELPIYPITRGSVPFVSFHHTFTNRGAFALSQSRVLADASNSEPGPEQKASNGTFLPTVCRLNSSELIMSLKLHQFALLFLCMSHLGLSDSTGNLDQIPAMIGNLDLSDSETSDYQRNHRGLNRRHYANVIDQSLSLSPINGRDETSYDHGDHDEVIFLDKECCAHDGSYANHLRKELILEQQCLVENKHVSGIRTIDDDFYFFLQWDTNNAEDCLDGMSIDFESFCISKIEYEQTVSISNSYGCVAERMPTDSGAWWMDDIDGDNKEGTYSSPYFDANNLIVYVVDTVVNLEHEHFDHIPDANKEYLGTVYVGDTNGDHGTHVTGSIVGHNYGVIRDPSVTVKTCNAFPYGSGSISTVLECIELIEDDLETETEKNHDVRAVINLSLTSNGCYAWFDAEFQHSMSWKCTYLSILNVLIHSTHALMHSYRVGRDRGGGGR